MNCCGAVTEVFNGRSEKFVRVAMSDFHLLKTILKHVNDVCDNGRVDMGYFSIVDKPAIYWPASRLNNIV